MTPTAPPATLSDDSRHIHVPGSESLPNKLIGRKVRSDYPDRSEDYFPQATYGLITAEAVRRHWPSRNKIADDLIHFIVNDARRLFTIVVTSFPRDAEFQLEAMKSFHIHGIRDSDLSPQIKLGHRKDPWLQPDLLKKLDNSQHIWDLSTVDMVCEKQWKVLIPVFSTQQANYDLGVNTILPFLKVRDSGPASGAFSRVTQVRIEEGHLLGEMSTSHVC